ncbi:hypothetical protein [Methylobacterium longum]|uniref:Uncharacterized protein n=1 Tax=Methylobacterium longum TaxID=767694 RepID=A0ABT8ASG7_9HYPH|nr:hypothetical protein [Methylobacterium longum]MDN3572796.1 hypothetical protein [Methylobacterium longum]
MTQQNNPGADEAALGAGDVSAAQVDNPDNASARPKGKQPRRLSRDDPKRTARIIREIRPDLSFDGKKFWSHNIDLVTKSEIYKRIWRFLKNSTDEDGMPFRPKPADFQAVYDALREELSNGAWQARWPYVR